MAALPEKATHRQTRVFNQQLVLRAIYDRSAMSRADVARQTGLTRTSVSKLVADLLRGGLVGLMAANGSSPTLGIGIGAPGLIDTRTGTVHWSVNLNWAEVRLGDLVRGRYGLPVVVVNDSHAAALAELTFSQSPRPRNLVVVRVGVGIGAGIILDGRLFQGDRSGAGEIGHTVFDGGSEPCHCGRVGCLETTASMSAMVSAAGRLVDTVVDDPTLIAAARTGDTRIMDVVVNAGEKLGIALGALIGALNVETVLLIGPAVELGDEWLAAVRAGAGASVLPLLAGNMRIELGAGQKDDVVIGASALLMTHELGLSLAR